MNLTTRIEALTCLGDQINSLKTDELESLFQRAGIENPWFTKENCQLAVQNITGWLNKQDLEEWTKTYQWKNSDTQKIGIVMAGNIPLVGFHDLLCVLISGHRAVIKTSSKDAVLIQFVIQQLLQIEPLFDSFIQFQERLNGMDAVIATGSDNTARYFDYYFRDIPHIIRKNRTSVAILDGKETENELAALGKDILQYFGLGCRSVSKIFVPRHYDPTPFFQSIESLKSVGHHTKYVNNYEYQKSILLINGIDHLDNGFLLWVPHAHLVSPISTVYIAEYDHVDQVKAFLIDNDSKIQCKIGHGYLPFGTGQQPALSDYADQVDTLAFLKDI